VACWRSQSPVRDNGMKIIVLAHPKDDHAAPVCWALEQAGYQTACWSGVSPAEQDQASLLMDDHPCITLGTHRLESDDVLWLRQPDPPADGPPGTKAAASPHSSFFDALAYMLENLPVRCINRYSASRLVRNKAVQLRLAAGTGLKVPETLMANSPAAVREFFHRNPHQAICKAFGTHVWQQQGSTDISVTETFCLDREELPADDEVFTYAPAIYQQMVRKQFDVRMVLMGERVYSFAVRTSANSLDWRHDAALKKVSVELIATPAEVESGILRFAAATGVCTGSLDFAVDRNGEWWFLEINEQGQFLWLDDFCPQAQLLEKFCAFLTAPQGSKQTLEERQGLFPSIAEYQRFHQKEEALNIATVSADAPFKSMEP
jgi:glutathione synthase/RimK-type ligase-like ATP-grasp enzyme